MRVEGVVCRIVQHVGEAGHVDVSEARQAAEEVGGVVVRAEQAAELGVEHRLGKHPAKPCVR